MPQGTVKWFNDEKGYGFITPDDGGQDLFVHYSGIAGHGHRALEEGAKVSYEETRGRKGMQAENVSKDWLAVTGLPFGSSKMTAIGQLQDDMGPGSFIGAPAFLPKVRVG